MKKEYPKKIKKIMSEAPMAYSILMLLDYTKNKHSANELWRRWVSDKKAYSQLFIITVDATRRMPTLNSNNKTKRLAYGLQHMLALYHEQLIIFSYDKRRKNKRSVH